MSIDLKPIREVLEYYAKQKKYTFEPPNNFRALTPAHKALAHLDMPLLKT